jgi:hypothetical protein
MGTGQENVTHAVLDAVGDFLGGPTPDRDGWGFDFGEHLNSNWGAVYGGALGAGVLAVARAAVPDRSPRSLHLQIVRSVPNGLAHATATVRHAGRTVVTVEIEMLDARGKLAVLGLATMVTPEALAAEQHDTGADRFQLEHRPLALDARFLAPIQRSLEMIAERNGEFVGAYAANRRTGFGESSPPVGHVTVPWDDLEPTGPEAACLGADAMIVAPLMYTAVPNELIGPNPDLTLRFTTAPATREVLSAGTVLSLQHGSATVALEVQAGDQQLAHGLATSLLLAPSE